ncbi:MAG: hypothetical protein KC910_03085 [Candidatus Eremiobacteraeota bacterium]|nr:hypothetical protein [Candidatus Eremiobacteraeota bacterium]
MSFRHCVVLTTVALVVLLGLGGTNTRTAPVEASEWCLLPNADWLNYGLDESSGETEFELIAMAGQHFQVAVSHHTIPVGLSLNDSLLRGEPVEDEPLQRAVLAAAGRRGGLDLLRRSCSPVALPEPAGQGQSRLVVSRVGFDGDRAFLVCLKASGQGWVERGSLLVFIRENSRWRLEREANLFIS